MEKVLGQKNILFLFIVVFFSVSCARLQTDETKAFPLFAVSWSQTPENQEIRKFIQYGDLIYAASGSGGILVYRIVGDSMDPVSSLSLTNLYTEDFEPIYVRTVEVVETEKSTNLIFAFDTLSGGGFGAADISQETITLLGSLKTMPGLRIRNTITTFNPKGIFHILAADETIGIVSYDLTISSNSLFEQHKVAALVDFISRSEFGNPLAFFAPLGAPGMDDITNISQISNIRTLAELAVQNKTLFSELVTNIPFLNSQQQQELQRLINIPDQETLSNIFTTAKDLLGEEGFNKVLSDPEMLSSFLKSLPQTVVDLSLPEQALSVLPNLTNNQNLEGLPLQALSNMQNGVPLNPLQELTRSKDITAFLNNSSAVPPRDIKPSQPETLYIASYLSNLKAITTQKNIDINKLHDPKYNPFLNRKPVGNAGSEIEQTIKSIGRKFFFTGSEEIKNMLYEFSQLELQQLFQSLFSQAAVMKDILPLLYASGAEVGQIYSLLQQEKYLDIIELLDASVLSAILKLLPQYSVKTDVVVISTNTVLAGVRNIYADQKSLYAALGKKGFAVIDRISGKIVSQVKRDFSEVSMIVPYEIYGKKYIIVADKLDGLKVYRRLKKNKIGEMINRITLAGEGFYIFPYQDLLWIADGVDGILGVRFNKDETLAIEAEYYSKNGIAYFIGAARRREVLVSYGSDGLVRLRITNVAPDGSPVQGYLDSASDADRTQDFIDRTLNWGRYSRIARFIRKFLLI
ncbi:MAG: hypothetical protein ACRCTQ_01050 [Brevinemataceae bacterium]